MGLLDRLTGSRDDRAARDGGGATTRGSLARDAIAMRATLTGMHAERSAMGLDGAEPDLRQLTRDLLEGEVEAPTGDVAFLIRDGVDPDEFYDRELAPSWDGLDELEREDKLDGFVELAEMLAASPDALPRDMAANLRTKLLVLGWAFDEAHGYLGRIAGRGRR